MSITAGSQIVAADFISTSDGTSGKVPKTTSGKIDSSFLRFGGTGADGALTITSGTTTLSAGSATTLTKNYTSISITGTGKLAFSTPHANGTIITLKSQGNVTLTSSTVPLIDASSMGAAANTAANSTFTSPTAGQANTGANNASTGGIGGTPPIATGNYILSKMLKLTCGSGGNTPSQGSSGSFPASGGGGGGASIINSGSSASNGSGSGGAGTSGIGGIGGGALLIECAGSYNCTGTIYAKGAVGGNGSGNEGPGAGAGGGGMILILYNVLTADTGTYTVTGGVAGSGTGNTGNGGNGGLGFALSTLNTDFC